MAIRSQARSSFPVSKATSKLRRNSSACRRPATSSSAAACSSAPSCISLSTRASNRMPVRRCRPAARPRPAAWSGTAGAAPAANPSGRRSPRAPFPRSAQAPEIARKARDRRRNQPHRIGRGAVQRTGRHIRRQRAALGDRRLVRARVSAPGCRPARRPRSAGRPGGASPIATASRSPTAGRFRPGSGRAHQTPCGQGQALRARSVRIKHHGLSSLRPARVSGRPDRHSPSAPTKARIASTTSALMIRPMMPSLSCRHFLPARAGSAPWGRRVLPRVVAAGEYIWLSGEDHAIEAGKTAEGRECGPRSRDGEGECCG
jgi:hypothetical protein